MILTTLLAAGPVPPEVPEPDLLEFLGAFETRNGQWLDPLILDDSTDEAPPTPPVEKRS